MIRVILFDLASRTRTLWKELRLNNLFLVEGLTNPRATAYTAPP